MPIAPESILSSVVAMVILAVGIFTFFVIIQTFDEALINEETMLSNKTEQTFQNISETGNDIMNITGVVLVVGAIVAIGGLIFSYMGSSPLTSRDRSTPYESNYNGPTYEPMITYTPSRPVKSQKKVEKKEETKDEKEQKKYKKIKDKYKKEGHSIREIKAKELLDE